MPSCMPNRNTTTRTLINRAMGVNYRHDGFVYDIVQKGPLLGISGRF